MRNFVPVLLTFIALRGATQAAAHLPLYRFDTRKAVSFSMVEAASIGLLAVAKYPLNGNWFVSGPASLLQHQVGGMFATYQTYTESRRRVSGSYGTDWQSYSYLDLLDSSSPRSGIEYCDLPYGWNRRGGDVSRCCVRGNVESGWEDMGKNR